MFRCGAKPDPFVAEAALHAALHHRFQHVASSLVAHSMKKLALRTNLLQGHQIASFMAYARYAIFDEFPRHVGEALARIGGGECLAPADLVKCAIRSVGHAAIKLTFAVLIEGTAEGIGRVFGDARHLEGLAVVEGSVATAIMNHDRKVCRSPVEIVEIELSSVGYFGVVEECPHDPGIRGHLPGFGAKLVDDAGD